MPEEVMRQSIIDEEHLKLLSLGYVISAAAAAFFSLFGLMYMLMGVLMNAVISHQPAVATKSSQVPPAFVGWIFVSANPSFLLGRGLFPKFSVDAVALERGETPFFLVGRLGLNAFGTPSKFEKVDPRVAK